MTWWRGVNPVTLKELRQMVRSRMVAVGLIVYLLAQLVGVSIVLMVSGGDSSGSLYGSAMGQGVFHMVFFLLSFLLLLCIPLFMGARMGLERGKEHLDLQFVTALKPRQFVDGKIASALTLALVFASASLPFLVLSYLLRGVDLFWVLCLFGGLLLVTVCVLYAALFLGAVGVSRTLRVFLLLGVILALLFLLGTVNIGSAGMMSSGKGSLFASWEDVLRWGVAFSLAVWGCLLARASTVAALSPAHANRALPVRLWFTACWLFWGALSLAVSFFRRDFESLNVWALLSVLGFSVQLGIAASLPPGYSRRVLGGVSPRAPLRVVQFFVFSGSEGGMAWALAVGFCTVVAVLLLSQAAPAFRNASHLESTQLTVIFLYLTAAVCSVRAAWTWALGRVLSHKLVGVLAFVLVALGCSLPYLLTLDSGVQGAERAASWFGNVAGVLRDNPSGLGRHMTYAGAWALVAWSLCMPAIFGAFRQFRRPAGAVPESAAED